MGKDYSVKKADGNINYNKYINTLDYSLDLIQLRESYVKKYRNDNFSFKNPNKKSNLSDKEYTPHVVNVTFNYSYKLYNKCNKNIFVRDGYSIRDIVLTDCVYVKDGKLIAIEVGKEIESNQLEKINCKHFEFNDEKKIYEQKGSMETLMNVKQLRENLYSHGFTIDGIKYKRWKRSSGSARVGKCLFINEDLYNYMHKWDLCGLKIKDEQDIDLAAFEGAVSLSLSSIIDEIEILPEEILVIDDYDSEFEDLVAAVTLEDGKLKSEPKKVKIKNSIWDGQSLLDKSVFGKKYSKYGMLLLRNRFFKSCCFNTNIQKWFADNNITEISQLNGFTLAEDISQIKMITTPNSIKYLKFSTLEQWLKNINKTFGIVKHDKPTYYFDGRMVQLHYQLLNTLQLSYEDMQELLQSSLDYISKIKEDPAVLRYHIRYPYQDLENLEYSSKNDVVFGLLGLNEDFTRTKIYQDFKKDLVKSLIKNLRRGHVLVNGTYATLFGNGLEMLKASIGEFKGESGIGIGNIYTKMFPNGQELLGTRSPHINSGNIYLAKNIYIEDFNRYFNLTKEIVCVNAIGENLLQRCNGADFDSDTLLITDNLLLIDKAKKNYDKFLVPTSLVEAKKTKRYFTNEQQADLDVKTSVNKIGEIVNFSQELNSRLWHNIYSNQTIEQNMELYYDICKLAVLSGIEIDKAKKEFLVDSQKEIDLLKVKYQIKDNKGKIIKPMFFKMITLENGYKINPKNKYEYRHTPMDYLQKIIGKWAWANQGGKGGTKTKAIPLYSIVKTVSENRTYGKYYDRTLRIIDDIRGFNQDLRKVYEDDYLKEEKKDRIWTLIDRRNEYIQNLKLGKRIAYLLLKEIDNIKNSDIKNLIFEILFSLKNKQLFEVLSDNADKVPILKEHSDGYIRLYNYTFDKIYKEI